MSETSKEKRRPRWPWIVLGGLGLVIGGLLYFLFPIVAYSGYEMEPTLLATDNVLSRRAGSMPERGELVEVSWPEDPHGSTVRRVIGLPGDTILFIDGQPVINGFSLPHCRVGLYKGPFKAPLEFFVEWLGDYSYGVLLEAPIDGGSCVVDADCEKGKRCHIGICGVVEGPYRVAPGEVFAVSDVRPAGFDSRNFGNENGDPLPVEKLGRRPRTVLYSGVEGRTLWPMYGPPMLQPKMASLQPALEKCWKETPPRTSP